MAGSHDHDDASKDARERDQPGGEDGRRRVNTADTAGADQYSHYERDRDDHYHR